MPLGIIKCPTSCHQWLIAPLWQTQIAILVSTRHDICSHTYIQQNERSCALQSQDSSRGMVHHIKCPHSLNWSNASDGPNLSMNMAFSLQLWCRKIAHGTHSNLQYSWAFKTSSHLEPCAIAATEAQAVATFSSYLTAVSQFVRFCLSTLCRKIP